MNRSKHIALRLKVEVPENLRSALSQLQMLQRSIIHDVTDKVNPFGNSFFPKVFDGCCGWSKQQRGKMICDYAVDFFRHISIEAAKTRFNVGHGEVELGRGKRTGESGVGIAIDKDCVGFLLQQHLLDPSQHFTCLSPVRT
jgi:hypothetical protein